MTDPPNMRVLWQWLAEFVPVILGSGLIGLILGRRKMNAESKKMESEARVMLDEVTWRHALDTIADLTCSRKTRDAEMAEMKVSHARELLEVHKTLERLTEQARLAVLRSEECEQREARLQSRMVQVEQRLASLGGGK